MCYSLRYIYIDVEHPACWQGRVFAENCACLLADKPTACYHHNPGARRRIRLSSSNGLWSKTTAYSVVLSSGVSVKIDKLNCCHVDFKI
jgi:hypothetical protein